MRKALFFIMFVASLLGAIVWATCRPGDFLGYGSLLLIAIALLLFVFMRKTPRDSGETNYFENFIRSYNGEAEDTRQDVLSIWKRMSILLDPNRPAPQPYEGSEDSGDYVEHVPTLMNCPDGNGRVSGLVIGRVQSGKTRNYVGLMLKAFDEHWNTVLVMTSNNKMLARQTWNRLLGTGRGEGDLYNRGKANATGMSRFDKGESGEIEFSWTLSDGEWREGNLYVGVIQKEDDHFRKVEHWLRSVKESAGGDELVKKIRLLVIDDEADNATPDSLSGVRDLTFTDYDVRQMANEMRAALDAGAVADWVGSLPTCSIDRDIVKNLIRQYPNPYRNVGNFKATVLDPKASIYKALGLSKKVADRDGDVDLGSVVSQYFDGRRTRNNPVRNAKTFVGLVMYAIESVPARTTINRYICELTSKITAESDFAFPFGNLAYIGYTATPYANILNENPQYDPLAADFMKSLKVSKEYFGLERFYGEDENRRLNVVRNISTVEEDEVIGPITDYDWSDFMDNDENPPEVSDDLNVRRLRGETVTNNEWLSLKQAITWLFCAAAARRIFRQRTDDTDKSSRWTTMIVNISHSVSVHGKLREWLSSYMQCIADNTDKFLMECQSCWEKETQEELPLQKFRVQCSPDYDDLDNGIQGWYPEWNAIAKEIRWFIDHLDENVHVTELNSTDFGKRCQVEYMTGVRGSVSLRDDHVWVVCGGNTISRGLTLDGLVVSYFDRIGPRSCVDTITQMGRWLGYRKGYELLPRIWMTESAKNEMVDIAKIERDMHLNLVRKFDRACSPKNPDEYAVIKYLGIRLTGRDAAMVVMQRSGISDYFNAIKVTSAGSMIGIIARFLDGKQQSNHMGDKKYSWQWRNVRACHYYKSIRCEEIVRLLRNMKEFYAFSEQVFLSGLMRVVERNPAVEWDVAIENPGKINDGRRADGLGIAYSNLKATPVNGVYCLKTQSYRAWFADVPNAIIASAECNMVEAAMSNGVGLPEKMRAAIVDELALVRKSIQGGDVESRLKAKTREMFKIARGSSEAYRSEVYKTAGKTNPVLHVMFATVKSKDGGSCSEPVVLLSYYWPGHSPDLVATPQAMPTVGLSDAVSFIREYFKISHRVISVRKLQKMISERFDGVPVGEPLIRLALRECNGYCSILSVPETENLFTANQIVHNLSVQDEPGTIQIVRKYFADKISEKFLPIYQRERIICAREIYGWVTESFPGCIKGNECFREFCKYPWHFKDERGNQCGLLNVRGIGSIL